MKVFAKILFRFRWEMENLLEGLGLGSGFILILPLFLADDTLTSQLKIQKSTLVIVNMSKCQRKTQ